MNTINKPQLVDFLPQQPVPETTKAKHSPEELKKVSQDFEALLINSMFKSMRKTIPDGGLFEKDTSHQIYEEMLDAEISKELSRQQRLGIAETIYEQVKKFQNK